MGEHEPSLDSGVMGSDVTSAQTYLTNRAKNDWVEDYCFHNGYPHQKNTRGRFVTVEITLETIENVRNRRENSHGIDNRVPRISHVRVDLFSRFVTQEKKPCVGYVIGTVYG